MLGVVRPVHTHCSHATLNLDDEREAIDRRRSELARLAARLGPRTHRPLLFGLLDGE
jgi:hypothetical protein